MNEFEFIDHIKSKYSLKLLGDDCAVLVADEFTDKLVTSDMLVEDVDFKLDWADARSLGHKSLAVSLSDIAAMGGDPKWALLSLAVPERLWDTQFLDEFYEGWMALAGRFSVELAGGDISKSPDKLVIDSTVGGIVDKGRAILRSGAKPGDLIYVTGTLGGAAAGLKLLQNGLRAEEPRVPEQDLLLKQLKPTPQLEVGKLLQRLGLASSMIDVSDGLSSDLSHICSSSRTGALIRSGSLPLQPDLALVFPETDRSLNAALNGGEDFELLFTVYPDRSSLLAGLPVTEIGVVTPNEGVLEIDIDGDCLPLEAAGFRHF